MNFADKADVVSKVQDASYANDFIEVFGANAFSDVDQAYDNIAAAIAVFEASGEMNPFTSRFDAVMAGNASFFHADTGLGLSMQDYIDLENFILTLTDSYF